MFRKAECKHTSVTFCFYICLQIHSLPSLSCFAFQDVKLYHSGSLALAPSCVQPIRSIVWWLKDGRGERLRTPPYPPIPGPPRVSRALVLNSSLCSSVPGDGTTFPLFLSPGSFFIHHGFLEPSPLFSKWSLLGLSNEAVSPKTYTCFFPLPTPNPAPKHICPQSCAPRARAGIGETACGTAFVATVSSECLLSLHDSRPAWSWPPADSLS